MGRNIKYYIPKQKDYFQQLLNFDNTPKFFDMTDDIIITIPAQQCNIPPEKLKLYLNIYYDILMKRMHTEKKQIGYLENPYLYLICNNEKYNPNKETILMTLYRQTEIKIIKNFKYTVHMLCKNEKFKQMFNENNEKIYKFFIKQYIRYLTNNIFNITNYIYAKENINFVRKKIINSYNYLNIEFVRRVFNKK